MRDILATMVNMTYRGPGARRMEPQDFYKLSFDKPKEVIEERTDEEILSRFPKKFNDVLKTEKNES